MSSLLPTADVLAAGALALGVLTVMYSLWMPAITSALSQERMWHRADRDDAIKVLAATQHRTALPLAVATTALLLVLAPSAIAVIYVSVTHARDKGFDSILDYRPALAVFLIVMIFLIGLTALTWGQVRKLATTKADFEKPDRKDEN